MGLFDNISNMVSGVLSGNETGGVGGNIMSLLQEHGAGGVTGIISQFEQSGLGPHVASWVGQGPNVPITADDVQKVFGLPMIASIAAKLGVDPATASQMISEHLPAAVSNATPDGQVPLSA